MNGPFGWAMTSLLPRSATYPFLNGQRSPRVGGSLSFMSRLNTGDNASGASWESTPGWAWFKGSRNVILALVALYALAFIALPITYMELGAPARGTSGPGPLSPRDALLGERPALGGPWRRPQALQQPRATLTRVLSNRRMAMQLGSHGDAAMGVRERGLAEELRVDFRDEGARSLGRTGGRGSGA